TQHLDRRLAQDRDVERGALGAGGREHHLVRQRGLAAAGAAGDEVERKLGQPATENIVETWDPGRQLIDHDSLVHEVSFAPRTKTAGQTSLRRRSTSPSPMSRSRSSTSADNTA